ncbi:MAG TPA: hypothetical protein VFB76_07200 [Candidatus Angelobacter sp.]|nr:hypothetical protein [Candidatus Angelobacter sp.]
MKPKLVVKLAVMIFSLATMASLATQAQPAPSLTLCRQFATLCSTKTSIGTCGFRAGQVCTTCYGNDGSTLAGGCPQVQ